MHPRQPGPATVTAPNQMLTPHTHTISHAGPPGGTPMGYPPAPYANPAVPPGNVNPMGGLNPTTMMGPSGQPSMLTSYGHVARAGPQMGAPNGGVPGPMGAMGAGRGAMVAMPAGAPQPNMTVRYGGMMRPMPNGMNMPATMVGGMGRGGGVMPPMGMGPRPVQRIPQPGMQPHPGMAPGAQMPQGSQVPQTHFQPGQPTMGPMGVPQRVVIGQPTTQPQFGQPAGATPSVGMGTIQMGVGAVNNMAPGSSPVRNPSPHSASASAAATPGNAPTPGGRPVQKPPTPVNAATPFNPANAPTPITRPSTGTHPQAPLNFPQTTPRMTHAEAMQGLHQGSPNNPARGPGMTPSAGPTGGLPVGTVFRPTPSDMVQQQSELYGPPHSGLPPGSMPGQPPPGAGPTAGPMEGVRYATMPHGMQQMHQIHQQRIPTQAPGQPAPLQPQLTGGSMQGGQPMQLAPQHTGGSIQGGQPLVPQHTGGSVQGGQGEMMVGATGPGPVPGRASVPPSTPRNVVIRPPGMPFTNAPPMGVGPGPVSMGAPPHIMGPSMGMTMVPPGMGSMVEMRPPPGPHPMRSLPMEVNEIGMNVATMPPGPRRHNFGVLRLLQFSSQLGNINERKSDFWSTVIANNFTDTATLSIRSHKDTGLKLNSFVEVPFALLTRFFLTLSQSRVHRMSFVLDGAIETQEGQDYIVSCRHAKWPMYYENGYVIELTGVLIARCKVVPMLPAGYAIPSQSPPTGPDGAAAATKPNTASPNANASPANNSASPNSNNPNNPNLDPKLHSSAYKVPYIVKIDSLSFDSENVFKYVNVACIFKRPSTDPNEDIRIPEEPGNIYGIPVLTMRVIEFIEGSQALEPVMEHFGDEAKKGAHGPLEAMESLVKAFPPNYMMLNQQTIFPPPKPQPLGELARIFPPTPPIPFLAEPIKLEEDSYNMDPEGAHLNGDDNSSMQVDASGLPLGIPAGVQPSLTVMATPGSTSAPTASPTISTKTPGKKQAAPDSPTKSEKDKAPKRRNTTETTDLPPAKRTRTQGRKPSRA